jgi:hypothetical protein
MSKDWSIIEVKLIIADYFDMLKKELSGISYNKTDHRHNLLPLLSKRSEGSIEFKHQNISAILIAIGQPYIKGYIPRYNYQKLLEDKVIDYLTDNINIEEQFRNFANKEVTATKKIMFEKILVDPPKIERVFEPLTAYNNNPISINYLEKEQNNKVLGRSGEELVLSYERWNLLRIGKEKLANQVRWISVEEGDRAGFDILSKNTNGSDKYIEVKTTKLGKETPFYFSRNELLFSIDHAKDYHLFRLFNFEEDAKMFTKKGGLNTICYSIPISYKGYF